MINLTIDGKAISVPEGTTVLQAAREANIEIPTLCDHPELTPYGGCRLCLVEVEGARTLQPSCTLPVNNNMVVRTNTDRIKAARKFVLTLIFSERNHFCPYCQVSGGDCELQNAAYDEGMTHWPLQPNWQPYPVDASHPYIILENNRCILCRRCVRACGELVGNFTLGFEGRGARNLLVADLGVPLGESTCISCGVCVEVCPTGALIDRWSAYRGRETQVERTDTICSGCSIGCGLTTLTRDNNLVRIEGDWDAPANNGLLCEIGRFKPMAETRHRINTPLVRKDGALKAATWEEAFNVIAARMKPAGSKVAALISSRMSAEALHGFKQIFADGLHSDLVTTIEEGAHTALAASLADKMGSAYEGQLSDLLGADGILVAGTDLVKDHQVVGFLVKRIAPAGVPVVLVDEGENKLDTTANFVFKAARGNLDLALRALTAAVIRLGLNKKSVTVANNLVEEFAAKAGLNAEDILAAGRALAEAEHPVFVYGKLLTAPGAGEALEALLNLAAVTGAKLISTKGEANSLAASQYHLDKAFELHGQQAAYVAIGDEEPTQRLIKKLEGLSFLVVQAGYTSQLTAMADAVMPAAIWLEQDGHYLSLEGRLQFAHPVLQTAPDVRSNVAIFQGLAGCLGLTIKDDWRATLMKRQSPV
ncbi:MAG TPA: molybdopterin-dependent oxidoreductase, partial [Anaerolineaceae bacterium]|nr:molybdopterin-dependent oxidoreductase [Anaerolineaceae bacterium]